MRVPFVPQATNCYRQLVSALKHFAFLQLI